MAELTFTHNRSLLSGAGNRNWEQEQNKRPQHQRASVSHTSEFRHPSQKTNSKDLKATFWLFANYIFISFSRMRTFLCMPHHVYGDQGTICKSQFSSYSMVDLQPGQLVPVLDEQPSWCHLPLPYFQNLSAILWAAFASSVFLYPFLLDCGHGLQVC